jgi:prepilin-type N-terminal cleavage/methylation domain-containing protein
MVPNSLNTACGSLPARRFTAAFTLVELLVTVAVIAVLASLLLPALARAKESARGTVCVSNLRQMGLATTLYSMDFKNRLPGFRNWLYARRGDLTTGALYPYVKSKGVYMCPTDALEIAQKRRPVSTGTAAGGGSFGRVPGRRDYSYAMNCGICHHTDLGEFLEPARTMVLMEATLANDDYSGVVGPAISSRAMAIRHRGRGDAIFGDMHLDRMNKRQFDTAARTKRFWFPTEDASGPGGRNFGF